MLGLHGCTWAFSSYGKRGPLLVVVCGLLLAVASLIVVHGLSLSHGMRDTRRPGAEPESPALAGGFLTTRPPGKPQVLGFILVPFCDEDSCWERMPSSAWAAVTTIPQTGGANKKDISFSQLWSGEVQDQGAGMVRFWGQPSSGLQTTHILLCPHGGRREGSYINKDCNCIMRTHPHELIES